MSSIAACASRWYSATEPSWSSGQIAVEVRGPVGLVREDRQPAVDLHRVRGHDLAGQPRPRAPRRRPSSRTRSARRSRDHGNCASSRSGAPQPTTRCRCYRGNSRVSVHRTVPSVASGGDERRLPPAERRRRRALDLDVDELAGLARRPRSSRSCCAACARAGASDRCGSRPRRAPPRPRRSARRCARRRCAGRRRRAARGARASARTGAGPAARPPRCRCARRR